MGLFQCGSGQVSSPLVTSQVQKSLCLSVLYPLQRLPQYLVRLIITYMGSSVTKHSAFQQHNWRQIDALGHRIILYNDITMKSVERHEAFLECDQEQALWYCKWREALPPDCGVVDLYEYGVKQVGTCNGHAELYVITERIHMLQEIGAISKPEAFLVLRDVALGLKILFTQFGYFTPRPNIIGINSEGRTRVWVNENFAVLSPEEDNIPVQTSELAIVNNVIRILQAKTYADSSFPIDYPRNLDLNSVVGYVDTVFAELRGFEVDRVYIDRAEFNRKYEELRQRTEQEEISRRVYAGEQERRLKEIQVLHENLRRQQMELARREEQLKIRAMQQQEELSRREQAQREQQLQKMRQQELQRQREAENAMKLNNRYSAMPIGASNHRVIAGQPLDYSFHSAYGSPHRPAPAQLPPPAQLARMPSPQPRPYRPPTPQFSLSPAMMPPRPPPQMLSTPRQQARPKASTRHQNLRKEIEMVDSMILMQQDEQDTQNQRYVQSRLITYPRIQ